MRFPDSYTKNQIGFDFVLLNLDTVTPMGNSLKDEIKPYGIKYANNLLSEYENMDRALNIISFDKEFSGEFIHTLSKIRDIRSTFKKVQNGGILDEVELFETKYFSLVSGEIMAMYQEKNIAISKININDLSCLFELLDPEKSSIMTFYIYDSYSDTLKDIREEKKAVEALITQKKDDDITSLLEERNEIVFREEEEEYKVRKELSNRIKDYADSCIENIECFGKIDFLFAKCLLALKFGCVRPEINQGGSIVLEDAFHPESRHVLNKKNKEFTNITISMKNGVTLLTGANMGGKSVTIKTVTLNVYLCQLGFYVFASKMSAPVFDFVFYVSDDMQSIERGLSTFGAEIISLKEIISYVKATYGFIALDELARGTNPKEGRSIVLGVVEYLSLKQSIAFISTHYDLEKIRDVRHYQVIGLKNVDFKSLKFRIDLNKKDSVDILQKFMDYRLEELEETEVSKDAFNIASLLGLPDDIMDSIKKWRDINTTDKGL